MDDRERRYRSLVEKYPDNPLGHFSLGRYLVETGRHAEAMGALERCVAADPAWAAALLALGEARAGAGDAAGAREALGRARDAALAQNHRSLADEAEARIARL